MFIASTQGLPSIESSVDTISRDGTGLKLYSDPIFFSYQYSDNHSKGGKSKKNV